MSKGPTVGARLTGIEGRERLRPNPDSKATAWLLAHLDYTIPVRYSQTDRRSGGRFAYIAIYTALCIASRVKKILPRA